jgi:hypothetical protein
MRARTTNRRASRGEEPAEEAAGGMRLGRVVAVNDDHRVLVEYPGCAGPTLARVAVAADRARLQRAIDCGEVAVLAFDGGDAFRPLVLALLPRPSAGADVAATPPAARTEVVKADVDGRRVLIEGQDEIVFQCGKASVTLRRNGKVVIRGTHVETVSEGTNRIKGGQVRIN